MLQICIHDCYHYNVMTIGVLVCEGLAVFFLSICSDIDKNLEG